MPQSEDLAIALVVTAQADPMLVDLGKSHYLWIRDSLQNQALITQLEQRTTFLAAETATAEDLVLEYLDTVELHHPAWKQLQIIGAPLTSLLEEVLQEYSVAHIYSTADGFIVLR